MRWREPRAHVERVAEVERALIQAGVDVATSGNFVAALIDVAASLDEEATKRGKPEHWLCTLLADASDALDPGAIAAAAGDVFADALVRVGTPEWAASIAGWGVAKASEEALSSMLPGGQLVLGLPVLGMAVCPQPSSCPAQPRLSVPLLKVVIADSTSPIEPREWNL